jgi:hypothetical protein
MNGTQRSRQRWEINTNPLYSNPQISGILYTSTSLSKVSDVDTNEKLFNRSLFPDGNRRESSFGVDEQFIKNDRSSAAATAHLSEALALVALEIASQTAPKKDADDTFQETNADRSLGYANSNVKHADIIMPNMTRMNSLNNDDLFNLQMNSLTTRSCPHYFDPNTQFGSLSTWYSPCIKKTATTVLDKTGSKTDIIQKNKIPIIAHGTRIFTGNNNTNSKILPRTTKTDKIQMSFQDNSINITTKRNNVDTCNIYGTGDWYTTLEQNKHSQNNYNSSDRCELLASLLPPFQIFTGYQIGEDTTARC